MSTYLLQLGVSDGTSTGEGLRVLAVAVPWSAMQYGSVADRARFGSVRLAGGGPFLPVSVAEGFVQSEWSGGGASSGVQLAMAAKSPSLQRQGEKKGRGRGSGQAWRGRGQMDHGSCHGLVGSRDPHSHWSGTWQARMVQRQDRQARASPLP